MNDFSPLDGFIFESAFSVGWLDKHHFYNKGRAPNLFLDKLRSLMLAENGNSYYANPMRGTHQCPFCGLDYFSDKLEYRKMSIGSAELWIPTQSGTYFVAPTMIIHYIQEHDYSPPTEFWEAVMAVDPNRNFNAQEISDRLTIATD
uniref:DUF7919 family protein n=1 Tax=Methylopila musalis TaxID=1134781 RepID=UPI00367075F3